MGWQVELTGESTDIADLAEVVNISAFKDVSVVDGPNGGKCLAGNRFEFDAAENALVEAEAVLETLNGLARLRYANHRPVGLARVASRVHADGRVDSTVLLLGTEVRTRASLLMTVTRADGSSETISSSDHSTNHAQKIVSDPRLVEIVKILGKDITWQRLRVIFEKITALIGKSGNDVQALWQKSYTERNEVVNFKANAEDPRHSGIDAVHGMPDGQLKGTKMTIDEGFLFLVRLLNTYLDEE